MRRIGTSILVVTLFVAVIAAGPAAATNGYFAHGIGLRAKGMGGAAIAYPQDAMAAGSNPAGMAFVGNRLDLGVDLFRPDRGSEISGNMMVNGEFDANDTENFFMPELGYSRVMNDNLTLGLTLFGHGGMNTSYTTPIGLLGSTNAGVDLAQMFIVPSVAMKLNEEHAVGLGVNVVWQRFEAYGLENFDNATASSNAGSVTGNDYSSATGFGVRAGWLGHFGPAFSAGASYQSRTYMGEFEDYSGLFAEEGDFDIPTSFGAGIALTPTDGLVIAADVTQILYSEINSVANTLLPSVFDPSTPLGTEDGAGFGWEDVTVFKVGVAYDVTDALTLRGGYNYGGQPIPESETLFNTIAPGVVESHVTFGGTYAVSEMIDVTFAYMHAFESTVEGEDSIPMAFGGGEADLTMSQNSFGLGVGVLF